MADKPTADELEWGADRLVYCEAHRNPHRTGWCTVGVKAKIPLDAKTMEAAYEECRSKGFDLWQPATKQ